MSTEAEETFLGAAGTKQFSSAQYDLALTSFQQALAIASERKDLLAQSVWLGNIAVAHLALHDEKKAIEYLEKALTIAVQLADKSHEVHLRSQLGMAYSQTGLHRKALDCLLAGLAVAEAERFNFDLASINGHIGNVYALAGAMQKALGHFRKALLIAEREGDQRGVAVWTGNIGIALTECHEYAQAIPLLEKALETGLAIDDKFNVDRWRDGLTRARRSYKEKVAAAAIRDPNTTPSGWVFTGLAARLSKLPSIDDKISLLHSESSLVEEVIENAIHTKPPEEAFALIDNVKSMISAELSLRKRARHIAPRADIVTYGLDLPHVYASLAREPDLCVISFFWTRSAGLYAFVGYTKDNQPTVQKITVATKRAGVNLLRAIYLWGSLRQDYPLDSHEEVLWNLLHDIGEEIVSTVAALSQVRRILLIPHKNLYLLPLHCMVNTSGAGPHLLEEIAPTTYSSSLAMYYLRGKLRTPQQAKGLLVCLDTQNLGPEILMEKDYFQISFGDAEGFSVIDHSVPMPTSMSEFQAVFWASHGYSDPSSWERSYLSWMNRHITAKEIVEQWDLANTSVAVLSACETGLHKSLDDTIDEYLGLDSALHIAGATTVISSMWPVEETLATIIDISLSEQIFKHGLSASGYLRTMRVELLSGAWRNIAENAFNALKRRTDMAQPQQQRLLAVFSHILDHDRDAFQSVASWGAYRSFGSW